MISLVKDAADMKYVRVYKSMDTGWTTFDTMNSKGFRVYVHLTPGEKAKDAGSEFIKKASARPTDFSAFEMSYKVIVNAMIAATSNSYGYMVPENIDPEVMKSRWDLAVFWARNPWLRVPMTWYSIEEVELAIHRHFGMGES